MNLDSHEVMKESASTRLTPFFRFILPLFIAVAFAFASLMLAVQRTWIAIPFAFVALLHVAILIWFSPHIKEISFDDAGIYVMDGSEEVYVPWTDIDCIDRVYLNRWPTYAVKFRNPNRFGKRIFFFLPSQGVFRARMKVVDKMQKFLHGPDTTAYKIYKTRSE
jgi:hypothetical protein